MIETSVQFNYNQNSLQGIGHIGDADFQQIPFVLKATIDLLRSRHLEIYNNFVHNYDIIWPKDNNFLWFIISYLNNVDEWSVSVTAALLYDPRPGQYRQTLSGLIAIGRFDTQHATSRVFRRQRSRSYKNVAPQKIAIIRMYYAAHYSMPNTKLQGKLSWRNTTNWSNTISNDCF